MLHLGGGGASGSNGIGTAANDITGQIPALYPPSGWVGNLFGPGYYIEATISFDPSGADASNWPGLWGNTFFSYFNNANVGGVELDWAGMRAGGLSVPAYDMALRDWTPGNDPIVASNNDATPLPAGWDWSAMHTYAVLCVPSQENGGQGYCQTYADGKPYYRLNWTALGQWSRLDATPIGFIMNPPDNSSLNVGAVRIFVKDASHVIRR